MLASTVVVPLARRKSCLEGRNVQNLFGCPSASDFVCFYVVRQNMTNPHLRHGVSYGNNALAYFGLSAISHTRIACKLGPGAFTQKRIGGGLYCTVGAFSAFLCWQRAFTLDFSRFR